MWVRAMPSQGLPSLFCQLLCQRKMGKGEKEQNSKLKERQIASTRKNAASTKYTHTN
jgi:hypothetical protein